jgi:hypothetical protein
LLKRIETALRQEAAERPVSPYKRTLLEPCS